MKIDPKDKKLVKDVTLMVIRGVIDTTNELLDDINNMLESFDLVCTQAERRENREYKAMVIYYDRVRRVLDKMESELNK